VNPGVFSELAEDCRKLPLFPLPNVVFIPNTIVPLHVFESRYRDLVRDCLEDKLLLGIPTLLSGWENDYDGRPPVQLVAGVGRIIQHHRFPDGRYNIAVEGLGRVRINHEFPPEQPYRIASATLLVDQLPGGTNPMKHHLSRIRILLMQILSLHPKLQPRLEGMVNAPQPRIIDELVYLLIQDARERQHYLEQDRLDLRAELVLTGLAGVLSRTSESLAEA
jgi:Lon protease-like protein